MRTSIRCLFKTSFAPFRYFIGRFCWHAQRLTCYLSVYLWSLLIDLIVNIDFQLSPTKLVFLLPFPSLNGSKESAPFSNICAYREFVAMTINNKKNYIIVIVAKEKAFTPNYAWKTIELFYYKEFTSQKFWLDKFWAPSLLLEIAIAIRFLYNWLYFWAKTKFYIKQIQVKLYRFRILVQQSYYQIQIMESNIKYIQSLEI